MAIKNTSEIIIVSIKQVLVMDMEQFCHYTSQQVTLIDESIDNL